MWRRSAATRFAVPMVALGLLVSGCASSDDTGHAQGETGALSTTNDINPKERDELRDGGNLRLAISAIPENWNTLSIDGNDATISSILRPTMPRAYRTDAAGKLSIDTDYFTDIQLTSTDPQVVTYTINPKAVWSDGSPITWEDMRAQGAALNGADKRFLVAQSFGFDRVAKVERGVDDRQAVITFKQPYAEWQGQFAGEAFLFHRSVTADPEAFNKSLINGITLTAGPFVVQSVDRTQRRVVLGHNPKWWGAEPKLDTITFSVLDPAAMVPALQNNEIDAVGLGTIDDVRTAKNTPGIAIRRATSNFWGHLRFNGAPGAILADRQLRVAISKAIDRQGIVTAIHNGMVEDPKPLNSHVFLAGQVGYQDNSAPVAYDPAAAARMLDELGWKLNGDVREKDGRKLEIRDVMLNSQGWIQMAQIMQQNLAQVGVKLIIDTRPAQGLFTDVIRPGNFDVAQFSLVGDAFPIGDLAQVFAYNPDDLQGNYGRIGSPELNALIERTVSELDPQKVIELANEVDRKIFEEGHSLPLYQTPGNVGVRADLANYGAAGLASYDYTKIGFVK
ncbi:ABC transporter family substrate-binding protein [Nocardia brasiliensis]|uniref:ABC transporter family substrate-binding protein n=2 Tax=Nocardia brasiliensis TaxID=37326 RepID=A0A6G9Y1K8_NOCBR|nr:ABC transporter family substrate-binding protein [Nocardia brasiliensis]QIS07082.1 ABC transporter family substrate-binding protein [Nocardia brasiliensis]